MIKSGGSLAYLFMPGDMIIPAAILLAVTGIAFWVIGFKRWGVSLMLAAAGLTILPAILEPLIVEVIEQVPLWMVVVLLIALAMAVYRWVLTLFLGKEAAGHVVAENVFFVRRQLVRLPRGIQTMVAGIGGLAVSANPCKRMLGLILAVILAVLAGAVMRGMQDEPQFAGLPDVLSVSGS